MYEAIICHQSLNISRVSQNWAEQMAYYRFLNNSKVSLEELRGSLASHCQQQVAGLHVLALSDTSEINLSINFNRFILLSVLGS